jgi:hypothetical protein
MMEVVRHLVFLQSLVICSRGEGRMTGELAKGFRFSSLKLNEAQTQREAMAGAQTRPMRLTSLMKLRLVI